MSGTPPPFGKPGHPADTCLGHKLGFVGSFPAYIFMFYFMYLVMGVEPGPGSGVPGQLPGDTGRLLWFLCVQFGAGLSEFIPGFLDPGFCFICLLGLLCFRAAICFSFYGRRFPFTA